MRQDGLPRLGLLIRRFWDPTVGQNSSAEIALRFSIPVRPS